MLSSEYGKGMFSGLEAQEASEKVGIADRIHAETCSRFSRVFDLQASTTIGACRFSFQGFVFRVQGGCVWFLHVPVDGLSETELEKTNRPTGPYLNVLSS